MGAQGGDDFRPLDVARTRIEQPLYPDHLALSARGYDTSPTVDGRFETVVVMLPRAKAAARAMIHGALGRLAEEGTLWVDGQKTDGVDSIMKELRALTQVDEVHSKAHGKIFRVTPGTRSWVPADWAARPTQVAPGFVTRPGVFSADGIDPGSQLLARHLPEKLPTRLVDLGAGWGWLAAQALSRQGVEVLHLVEADRNALDSAQDNIPDPRARFHWADARDFRLPEPVNGIIMNPPFHNGREADPRLGAAFIANAARLLTGAGRLWMVANRHLPYEAILRENFAKVTEIGGDNRYKIFEASGAGRGANSKQRR